MLADPSVTEREVLGAIPYQRNGGAAHRRACCRAYTRLGELELPPPAEGNAHGEERATVTYDANILQRLGPIASSSSP